LAEIRRKFGHEAANIVAECSDTFETPTPPWRERKENYVRHLSEASHSALLVSLADKLHNAGAFLRDFREHGDELWQPFSVKDPKQRLGTTSRCSRCMRNESTTGWLTSFAR
jgi:(p)ppGpp synthase/HD superfamily hydrolase